MPLRPMLYPFGIAQLNLFPHGTDDMSFASALHDIRRLKLRLLNSDRYERYQKRRTAPVADAFDSLGHAYWILPVA